jgi:uncharacterized protein (DUF1800 family)
MLTPLQPGDWTPRHLEHLLGRAGFGLSAAERPRWEALKFPEVIETLTVWEESSIPDPAWMSEGDADREMMLKVAGADTPEKREARKQLQKLQVERLFEARMLWLKTMLETAHPLREKLTLFWHGHFATSSEKVRQTACMWGQNTTFRAAAMGPFGGLLNAMGRDPAMLVWLDGRDNRKGAPNENYAREMFELFTLGEGNYTEDDIKESARSFTGWTVFPAGREAVFRPRRHDYGDKTLFGKTGDFKGEDVAALVLQQPACAEFLAAKLWTFFVSPTPNPTAVAGLAGELRASNYDLKPVLRTLFMSQEFYGPDVMGARIKSPVEWMVGSLKLLGSGEVPYAGPVILRQLGQALFAPPSVKGWDGDRAWITTNTMMSRDTFVHGLIYGGGKDRSAPGEMQAQFKGMRSMFRPERAFPPGAKEDPRVFVDYLCRTFLAVPPSAVEKDRLLALAGPETPVSDERMREAVYAVMRSPRYQVV